MVDTHLAIYCLEWEGWVRFPASEFDPCLLRLFSFPVAFASCEDIHELKISNIPAILKPERH
jgi:hypothetical protein